MFVGNDICEQVEYWTTDTQIVCYTPAHYVGEAVSIQVSTSQINGITLATTTTKFTFAENQTPYLWSFPMGFRAGAELLFYGRLLGTAVTNYRLTIGGLVCELPEETSGLSGEYTFLYCVAPALEAGAYPVDALVKNGQGLGRAHVDPSLYQYTLDGRVVHAVAHPDVVSLSSRSGGTLGGAVLTISGTGFASNPTNNTVLVAGSPCAVITSAPTRLTCELGPVASVPPTGPVYGGGRGMWLEVRRAVFAPVCVCVCMCVCVCVCV